MESQSLSSLMMYRQFEHRERMSVLALASRNQSLAIQQRQREELLWKRDVLGRAVGANIGSDDTSPHTAGYHSHEALQELHQRRCSNSMYCAEQDLSLQKDICFGRGQRVQRREANIAFRKIVSEFQELYDQAESRGGKKQVITQVSDIFASSGYRFFKESEEVLSIGKGSKIWIAVSNCHVEYKIGHSFRSGRKIIKREQLNQQKLKATETQESYCVDTSDVGDIDNSVPCDEEQTKEGNTQEHIRGETDRTKFDIRVGEKRDHCNKMEACNYEYFREFVGIFTSIYEMSKSSSEKKSIVTSLIQEIKARNGYRFLVMRPPSPRLELIKSSRFNGGAMVSEGRDVEAWIEAPLNEIFKEVTLILEGEAYGKERKKMQTETIRKKNIPSEIDSSKLSITNKGLRLHVGQKDRKRSFRHLKPKDADNDALKKRQFLSQGKKRSNPTISPAIYSLPNTTKQVVFDNRSSLANPNLCDDDLKSLMRWKKSVSSSFPVQIERTPRYDLTSIPSSASSIGQEENPGVSNLWGTKEGPKYPNASVWIHPKAF